jgi:phosphohistidine phosphatase SixA
MIIFDDIQHILADNNTKQQNSLNTLTYLGSTLRVPLVGIGTTAAIRATQTDQQLANGFSPELLPKWESSQDLIMLLKSFERIIPLKKSSLLHSPSLLNTILQLSGGTIGEISALLNMAAIHAIKTQTEQITLAMLSRCNYFSA